MREQIVSLKKYGNAENRKKRINAVNKNLVNGWFFLEEIFVISFHIS